MTSGRTSRPGAKARLLLAAILAAGATAPPLLAQPSAGPLAPWPGEAPPADAPMQPPLAPLDAPDAETPPPSAEDGPSCPGAERAKRTEEEGRARSAAAHGMRVAASTIGRAETITVDYWFERLAAFSEALPKPRPGQLEPTPETDASCLEIVALPREACAEMGPAAEDCLLWVGAREQRRGRGPGCKALEGALRTTCVALAKADPALCEGEGAERCRAVMASAAREVPPSGLWTAEAEGDEFARVLLPGLVSGKAVCGSRELSSKPRVWQTCLAAVEDDAAHCATRPPAERLGLVTDGMVAAHAMVAGVERDETRPPEPGGEVAWKVGRSVFAWVKASYTHACVVTFEVRSGGRLVERIERAMLADTSPGPLVVTLTAAVDPFTAEVGITHACVPTYQF